MTTSYKPQLCLTAFGFAPAANLWPRSTINRLRSATHSLVFAIATSGIAPRSMPADLPGITLAPCLLPHSIRPQYLWPYTWPHPHVMSPVGSTNSHMSRPCLGPCPWPCLPRTHDTLWLHLWHMHDVIMHYALYPGTPAAPWCHHYIIHSARRPLCHNDSADASPHYDIIAPLWRHQWLHDDTPPSSSSIRLRPWCHAPGPVPQISDPMISYHMLTDYDLFLWPRFYL